jgi:hypothetical protein
MQLWIKEHGTEYAVDSEIDKLVDDGILTDSSWHHDTAPCFTMAHGGFELTLWVDHPNPELREADTHPRFGIFVSKADDAGGDCIGIYAGDSLAEVLKIVEHVANANR